MLVRSELQVWRAAIIEVNPAFAPDAVLHGNAAGGLQLSSVNRRQSAEAIVETEELRRIPPHRKKKSRERAESLIWIRDYYRAPVVK